MVVAGSPDVGELILVTLDGLVETPSVIAARDDLERALAQDTEIPAQYANQRGEAACAALRVIVGELAAVEGSSTCGLSVLRSFAS